MVAGVLGCTVHMVPEVVYLVATMTVLSTASVGVARSEFDVPDVVCWTLFVPLVAATSAAGVLLRVGFGVDGTLLAAGVWVAVLSLAGFYVLAE